jgi:N-acetylmuramoyl-L-alanine amidase
MGGYKVEIINSNLNFKGNLVYSNNPKMVIVHHADAERCTIQDINHWHLQNGWAGCGYHYFGSKDGKIYSGRDEKAEGYFGPMTLAAVVKFQKANGLACEW